MFFRTSRILDRLIAGGISVITPNGSTGEFYSLSRKEGHRVVDAAIDLLAIKRL
jgi:4-hydroxy-tetrahydrodipicolinate synthase